MYIKRFIILISLTFFCAGCSFDQGNHTIDTVLGKNQIELGMSQDDAKILLGKPKRIETDANGISKWYYEKSDKIIIFEDNQLIAISSTTWQNSNDLSYSKKPKKTYLCDQYNDHGNFPKNGGCNQFGCWVEGGNCSKYGCSYSKDVCTDDGCHTPAPQLKCIYGSNVQF